MKYCLLLTILIFSGSYMHAQTFSDAERIRAELSAAKHDTTRIMRLDELSHCYISSYPDSSFIYATAALELSRKMSDKKWESSSLLSVAGFYDSRGNYTKSIELCLEALAIAEETGIGYSIAKASNYLAYSYGGAGESRQSLFYSYKSMNTPHASDDTSLMMSVFTNMADAYEKLNLLDSALYFQHKAYSLAQLAHEEQLIGYAMINFGNIYSKKGNANLALTYYREAITYAITQSDFQSLNEIYLGMAKLFVRSDHKDSARSYAFKALQVTEQERFHIESLNATQLLADLYSDAKISDSAYKYLELTVALKDSFFNNEKTKELQNMTINESLRQQELAAEKARSGEEVKRNLQLLGIGFFTITFFLFVLLISQKKIHTKTIKFLGILALLLLFEFISLFIHPYIVEFTNHTPVFMFLISVSIAAFLVPTHHRMEEWLKDKLAHKTHPHLNLHKDEHVKTE